MTKLRGRDLSFIILFSLAVIGYAEPSPSSGSGLEGIILVSPSKPGPLRKDADHSTAPVANMAFVVEAGDKTVASFTTDAEGHFQVSLPPGHYVVSRKDTAGAIGQWTFEAEVEAGKMAKVRWTGDSGMR